MNIKNIIFANSNFNKIIFRVNDNNIAYILNRELIQCNQDCDLKLLLSDDLILNSSYKLIMNIKSDIEDQLNLFADINEGSKKQENIIVTNDWTIHQFYINFDIKQSKYEDNRKIEVATLNFLNLHFKTNKNINIEVSLKLIEPNQENKECENTLDKFTIYNYNPFDTYNYDSYTKQKKQLNYNMTYDRQRINLRYLFLKNVEKLSNKIVYIYSILENYPPPVGDQNMFYCDDIHIVDQVDTVTKFCSLIGKNRYYFGYECPNHACHIWKINDNFLNNNFDYVYSSHNVFSNKFHWVPAPHLSFFDSYKIEYTNAPKTKFMTNNPFNSSNPSGRDLIINSIGPKCDFYLYSNCKSFIDAFMPNIVNEKDYILDDKLWLSLSKKYVFCHYKYILVIENTSIDGYITEKLVDCLTCGSVPIYFGPKNPEIFFPELFENAVINGFKYTTEELLELLHKMTHEEYNIRVSNIEKLCEKMLYIFTEYSILNYMITDFFSQYNIDLYLSPGTKYLKELNHRLSVTL